MTDSELLNNCITHQVWEGASSLKCGFPLPGELQWAGDMCSSPEIVWFCVAKCCCICSPEAGGLSLLLSDPFPLELLLMGPFFWQKLRPVSCALTERLKGRWQNQTAHLCGTFASWIWPLVFLAHEFSFQPRSRSEQRVKLNFQVASVASHNLISQPDLDKAAGFWLHWKVGLDQTHPPLNGIAVWAHGGQGDMISPGSPTFSHLLPVWGEPAVSAGGLGLVRLVCMEKGLVQGTCCGVWWVTIPGSVLFAIVTFKYYALGLMQVGRCCLKFLPNMLFWCLWQNRFCSPCIPR